MLSLLLAVLCSTAISLAMRVGTERTDSNVGLLAMNYLICFVIAIAFTGVDALFVSAEGYGTAALLGSAQGLLYLLAFVLLQLNIRKNGVVLSAIFQRLGLLVPMVVSVLFFGEKPELLQIIGFLMALAAIILINSEKDSAVSSSKLGLILLLIGGGSGDAMSKVFEELGDKTLSDQFLFYTFAAALILCIVLMLVKQQHPGGAEIFWGLLIGVPNFFSAKFLLRSLEDVAAVIAYPMYSVATMLVITLAGVLFFREKLGKRQWAALGIILVALGLLNT